MAVYVGVTAAAQRSIVMAKIHRCTGACAKPMVIGPHADLESGREHSSSFPTRRSYSGLYEPLTSCCRAGCRLRTPDPQLNKRRRLQARKRTPGRGPCSQLAVVSILIKEKKQLKDAVRRYEAAEERMEKYKNGPLARQRLDRLLREVNRDGMQPSHVHELREILEEFPEDEAAPLRQKLIEYEWRRLLDLGNVPASKF